jgi:hypothetical protein
LFLLDGNSFLEVLSVGCLEVLSADEVNLEQVSCIVNRNLWELVIRQLKVHVLLLKVNDFPIELLNDCLVCLVRTWQHVELDDWLHRIVETYHPPIRYLKCLSKFLVFIFTALQQSRRALGLFLFSFCQSFSTSQHFAVCAVLPHSFILAELRVPFVSWNLNRPGKCHSDVAFLVNKLDYRFRWRQLEAFELEFSDVVWFNHLVEIRNGHAEAVVKLPFD